MSQMNTLTQKELVKRYLIGATEPLSIKQIAIATGVNNGSVGSLIYRFRADGLIESIDNGATQAATHFWIGSTALNETDTPTEAEADTCCGQCTGDCSEVEQGAYHGMVQPHPDDAPEVTPPYNAYISALETGAFHGMIEPHPDDEPDSDLSAKREELKYLFGQYNHSSLTEPLPDDAPEIVFESYRDSLIASLNAAETALVVYRKRRRIDPIEAGLLAAIEALEATLKGACHE